MVILVILLVICYIILSYVLSLGVVACQHSSESTHRVVLVQFGRIQDFFFKNLVKRTQNVGEDIMSHVSLIEFMPIVS
jgi:hypothetical protein